jgi:hypothetical protein
VRWRRGLVGYLSSMKVLGSACLNSHDGMCFQGIIRSLGLTTQVTNSPPGRLSRATMKQSANLLRIDCGHTKTIRLYAKRLI